MNSLCMFQEDGLETIPYLLTLTTRVNSDFNNLSPFLNLLQVLSLTALNEYLLKEGYL